MKKMIYSMAIAALTVLQGLAAEAQWLTDLDKAKTKAKEENKAILINFTGSDWCGFCIKLQKEVFSKSEFKEYADKNLVLVEVDFPSRKKLSPEQKKINEALKEQFKIDGFPTLVILGPDGKKLGEEVGYGGGGAKKFIQTMDKYVAKARKS
jgi:protein disulfide-isomerase